MGHKDYQFSLLEREFIFWEVESLILSLETNYLKLFKKTTRSWKEAREPNVTRAFFILRLILSGAYIAWFPFWDRVSLCGPDGLFLCFHGAGTAGMFCDADTSTGSWDLWNEVVLMTGVTCRIGIKPLGKGIIGKDSLVLWDATEEVTGNQRSPICSHSSYSGTL